MADDKKAALGSVVVLQGDVDFCTCGAVEEGGHTFDCIMDKLAYKLCAGEALNEQDQKEDKTYGILH